MMRALLIAISLVLSFIFLNSCSDDSRHSRYADVAEINASGPGARSWFPASLPKSAKSLEEVHDLDTNDVIGRFSLDSSDFANLASKRSQQSFINAEIGRGALPGWPQCLTGHVDEVSVKRCGYLTMRDGSFQIVLDPRTMNAFFWNSLER